MGLPATSPISKPRTIVLLTWPRTASNLAGRILSRQPDVELMWHPYQNARSKGLSNYFAKLSSGQVTEEDCKTLQAGYQECYTTFVHDLTAVRDRGRRAFIQEHINWILDPEVIRRWFTPSSSEDVSNSTTSFSPLQYWTPSAPPGTGETDRSGPLVIPDHLTLRNAVVIIPFRHPALTFSSQLRKYIEMGDHRPPKGQQIFNMSYAPLRHVYDWLLVASENRPILLDMDEVTALDESQRDGAMKRLCDQVGFDSAALRYKWEVATEEERAAIPTGSATMLETLINSTGVMNEKSGKDLVLSTEFRNWEEEFSEDDASFLKTQVLSSMEHYEYLRTRRVGTAPT